MLTEPCLRPEIEEPEPRRKGQKSTNPLPSTLHLLSRMLPASDWWARASDPPQPVPPVSEPPGLLPVWSSPPSPAGLPSSDRRVGPASPPRSHASQTRCASVTCAQLRSPPSSRPLSSHPLPFSTQRPGLLNISKPPWGPLSEPSRTT